MIDLIKGATHTDSRGSIVYFNDFKLDLVKRFYTIEHHDTSIVRAWQGHKEEQKWFYVLAGSFLIVVLKIDDWNKPAENLKYDEFILSTTDNHILHVLGGYVNGFKAIQPDSKLMVFSNYDLKQSSEDDYRFDKSRWYNW